MLHSKPSRAAVFVLCLAAGPSFASGQASPPHLGRTTAPFVGRILDELHGTERNIALNPFPEVLHAVPLPWDYAQGPGRLPPAANRTRDGIRRP